MLSSLFLLATAATAPDAEIKALADAMTPALVETRRDIHRNPELGNREFRTGKLVAERLQGLGGLEVRHPVARTGVVGVLKGGLPGRGVVALRADLDALPIQETNDVPYKSVVAGVKHACGHDAHTTILLGAAEVLAKLRAKLPGTVVFLFQPAEEGPPEGEEGGAALMIKEGALEAPRVQAVYGLHTDPFLEAGQAGWRVGPIFASSDSFTIEVIGRKTHGAYPETGLDPIPVAAEIVAALQTIPSRQLDARSPKVLTIGSIQGGNRVNIIADKVVMQGTMRTLDASVRKEMKERIARTVENVGEAHGLVARVRFDADGNSPTMNDAALTRASLPSLERVYGKANVREVEPQMGAEDFAALAERVPGLYYKFGIRNESKGIVAKMHTEDYDLDEAALPLAVRAMATLAFDYLLRSK
ncbi:MAG TPA: amidohydrolase [Vicinamibacteria bacterium]|nr:amidohydrolase [Vicinamibacteria bacterium]